MTVFALIFFHLLARKPNLEKSSGYSYKFFHNIAQKPNLEKNSAYSYKFFHNFHLSESSFNSPRQVGLCKDWYDVNIYIINDNVVDETKIGLRQ